MSVGGTRGLRRDRFLSAVAASICVIVGSTAIPALAAKALLTDAEAVAVKTKPIERFQIGRDLRTFGPLTFLGGLELLSTNRDVGGLSALLSLEAGGEILAVTDNGLWFAASVEQNDDGVPTGIADARLAPLLDTKGKPLRDGWRHDTEALAIDRDSILVSAEQYNGIFRFPWPLVTGTERMIEELEVSEDIKSLRGSKGLEAMAIAPAGSPLAGTLLAIAERGAEGDVNIPGFLLKDGRQDTFTVVRSDRYDVTDAAFLSRGDLLILERRFNLRDLVGMRLRRFKAENITPGAMLTGDVLMEADYGYQIDNMEGVAIHEGQNGETILTLLSDNNRSILQRTLLLRFKLDDE
ncbi:esterase-like activity of phytase family protein [Roseibium sp.]|uniref:esterase-like activity of phytase family protein n=1 Tax=Roseibium sp. TaxID=1936156 RepID=UPI003A97ED0D